jgi:lipopolysaccharide biosynthesis glycosyltransferase
LRSLGSGYRLQIHVIDAGLAVSSKQRLVKLVTGSGDYSIHWLPAPSAVFDGIQRARYHLSAYYRLALPEILDLKRVIYLDADTLIFGCLGKLWEEVMVQNELLLAVQDRETQTLADDSSALVEALGLEDARGYFNSGVLVLRLDLLRAENFTARVCAMLTQNGRAARFADQSALNWYCAGRWVQLESRWNLPAWAFDEQHDNELPAICHYTNHAPWLKRLYSPSQALFERVACELGFDLPKAEPGIGHAACRALKQWALAPVRAGYQWAGFVRHKQDAQGSCASATLACYWWRYFIGGPSRVLRYRRRIREIRSDSFSPFTRSSS